MGAFVRVGGAGRAGEVVVATAVPGCDRGVLEGELVLVLPQLVPVRDSEPTLLDLSKLSSARDFC